MKLGKKRSSFPIETRFVAAAAAVVVIVVVVNARRLGSSIVTRHP